MRNAKKLLLQQGLLRKGESNMNILEEHFKDVGRWEGEQKGIQRGIQGVILKMLKKKTNISFISEVTGVSVKKIKKMKKESL